MIVFYWLTITVTGLSAGGFMWLAFHPATPLRIVIFGGLAIGTVLIGFTATDRIRP